MKKEQKNKQGISLIVLVITIIIMIILATAVILSLSSSDIVDKANTAVADTKLSQANERATMCIAEWELMTQEQRETVMRDLLDKDDDLQSSDVTVKKYVEEKLKESGILTQVDIDNEYEVAKNGRVIKTTTSTTYTMVASADETSINVPVPSGFTASIYQGEKTVAGGFVIYETNSLTGVAQETAQTTYNQFVWVPVEGGWQTGHYWGIGLSFSDGIEEGTTPPQEQLDSINTYGGFYIARYEAGLPNGGNISAIDGTQKPVSIKGSAVWNEIPWDSEWNWGGTYGNPTNPGCALVASKAYEESNSVTSSLMYGAQWDAALKFIEDEQHSMTNSILWGNHDGNTDRNSIVPNNPAKTGACENWKGKNIYDMAGNVYEWTYEACTAGDYGFRVLRGGGYCNGAVTSFPASSRLSNPLNAANDYCGFRVQLFLK